MHFSPTLLLALAAVCAAVPHVRADDATKIDPAARVDKLAPGPDTAKPVDKIDLKRADRVQESRATLAGLIEEPTASIADRRAPIEMTEAREKTMIDHKNAPVSTELLPRKDSAMAGQTARERFQPTGNASRNNGVVAEQFQDGIRNANKWEDMRTADATGVRFESGPDRQQSAFDRQTTFDQLNRFVFKRNGPGSEDGAALVTAAGGGQASVLPTAASSAAAPLLPKVNTGSIPILGIIAAPGRPPPQSHPAASPGVPVVPPAR